MQAADSRKTPFDLRRSPRVSREHGGPACAGPEPHQNLIGNVFLAMTQFGTGEGGSFTCAGGVRRLAEGAGRGRNPGQEQKDNQNEEGEPSAHVRTSGEG